MTALEFWINLYLVNNIRCKKQSENDCGHTRLVYEFVAVHRRVGPVGPRR